MPVLAHAAARAVAQGLGAVHRARHAGGGEGALPAHLAVEQQALGRLLEAGERLLQLLVADPAPQRMQRDQRLLERAIERVEPLGMAHRPETDGIHLTASQSVRASATKTSLPQVGGGLGWGLFYRAKNESSGSAGAPTLALPRLGGGKRQFDGHRRASSKPSPRRRFRPATSAWRRRTRLRARRPSCRPRPAGRR